MDVFAYFKANELFKRFSHEEIALFIPLVQEVFFNTGEYLMHEGELGEVLFILKEGEVEGLKHDPTGRAHQIFLLGPRHCVGEMALLDDSVRSATVRATKPTSCYALSLKKFSMLSHEKGEYAKLKLSLAEQLGARVRKNNEKILASLHVETENTRQRLQLSHFLITLSVLVFGYALTLKGVALGIKNPDLLSLFTDTFLLFFVFLALGYMIKSGRPWSYYGVNFSHWKKDLQEGVLFTFPVLVAMFIGKWALIHTVPAFKEVPLFDIFGAERLSTFFHKADVWMLGLLNGVYLLLVPLQELIARGAVQGSCQDFFIGPHRKGLANFVASLYFTIFHLHQPYLFALSALAFGLFFGWIFARQNTLVGCSVAHILISIWGFCFLDYSALFIF